MFPETPCQKLHLQFSFMKAFLFLLMFLAFLIFLVGFPILCTVLILKPKMPDFSLQTVNIQSYKINLTSRNILVSSVLSLNLRAENPNRVGLSYDSTRFHVLSQGLVVGLIRIPQFHQPPLSKNVSIQTRVLFECVNVSAIMYGNNSRTDDSDMIRILGDVKAQVRIFNIILPKIKVALDCGLSVSPSGLSVSNEVHSIRWNPHHMISLPLNSQTVSKKCSLAILV